MPNDEQAEYWDGPGGEHWVAEADRYSRMTGPLGEVLVEAADPRPGERVLDIGCGMGATTLAAAERVLPGGSALGVDLSGPMLAVARERANRGGLTHVAFEQADAQVRPFDPGSFDLAVSRFGVMFFDDPNAAFANLGRALRSGGRLVFVCWQGLFENEWLAVPVAAALQHVPVPEMGEPGAPGPFSLADAGHVEALLTGAGFGDVALESVELPLRVGESVADFVEFGKHSDMGQTLMEGVDEATAHLAWSAVAEAVKPHATPDGLFLNGKSWLVRAVKP